MIGVQHNKTFTQKHETNLLRCVTTEKLQGQDNTRFTLLATTMDTRLNHVLFYALESSRLVRKNCRRCYGGSAVLVAKARRMKTLS